MRSAAERIIRLKRVVHREPPEDDSAAEGHARRIGDCRARRVSHAPDQSDTTRNDAALDPLDEHGAAVARPLPLQGREQPEGALRIGIVERQAGAGPPWQQRAVAGIAPQALY